MLTTNLLTSNMLTTCLLTVLLVSPLVMAQEERLLQGLEEQQEKAIQYKSAGDYTLVSIPWSGSTSLAFNDSTAATISTLGNAALLVGGLYLLSGFPTALARSDPFGVQRRFGKPAPPAKMYKPSQKEEEVREKSRRQHRYRGVQRRGPAHLRHSLAEERTLPLPQLQEEAAKERQFNLQRPVLPQFRPFQLPRMPSLPRLRLPSFPGLGRRPRPAQPRPSPGPQSSRPAPPQSSQPAPPPQSARPAPAPQSARPAPPSQSARPALAPQTPAGPSAPLVVSPRPQSIIAPVRQQSAPLNLPNPRPVAPSDFGSAFDSDPFQEFQSADFGNDQSFQDLIATQFGDSFDFQKLKK